MDKRPIGVFDSGVGGLTVLREIIEQLPFEDIVYFGDTARIPYGSKSPQTVIKFANQCASFLLSKEIKAIVIACNTASSVSIEDLKKNFDVPIIGVIQPGATGAIKATNNNKIGVIGTSGTIRSGAYQTKIRELNSKAEVIGIPCPLFVHLVEEGWEFSYIAELAAEKYLIELKEHEIDTLVLGCTHYPLLRYVLKKVMSNNVTLVNPAYETAKSLKTLLTENNMLNEGYKKPCYQYFVSDATEKFRRIGGNILKMEIENLEKIDIENY